MNLAEYNRVYHPGPQRAFRTQSPVFNPDFEVPMVHVPVKTITVIKGSIFAGMLAAAIVPPQYAAAVSLVVNAYWLFKL